MIRGRKRPMAKAPEVKANLNCSIHNRFDIEVVDTITGEIKQRAQAENVICNALWTKMFTPATWNNYIHYGTGTGTPVAADTSLFTFLGYGTPSAGNDLYSYNYDAGIISLRRKIQLSENTAVGSTLTEVGIAYGTSSSTLATHAMLKDMNGNQISIAKTATDIVNIYATVFVHWAAAGFDTGYINFIRTKSNLLLTALLGMGTLAPYTYWTSIRGGIVCDPSGFPSKHHVSTGTISYSPSNKTVTFTSPRIPAASGNMGGIKTIELGNGYAYLALKVGGVWFPDTAIVNEAIGTGDGTTKDFATDFPFVSDATIYVDSVVQSSGVAVDENKPISITHMGYYFEFIESSDTANPSSGFNPEYSGYSAQSENAYSIFYNPYYSLGISSYIGATYCTVSVSDDLETWVQLSTASGTISVPAGYRNYKYWKFLHTSASSALHPGSFTTQGATANNIHFTTAPASGAVITADYTTKTIAKDANHVFDLAVTIQLGEKTT